MSVNPLATCQICGRELGTVNVDYHHLMPKTFKGKSDETNLIPLHRACHRACHAFLSEKEMEKYYHTVERLLEKEEIQKFAKWIAKKPPEYYVGTDETAERKKKRRR